MFQSNISLKPYNTFGINFLARYFSPFESVEYLGELLELDSHLPTSDQQLILGSGSNILFTKNFDGLVLKNELKGIELVNEDDKCYYIKVAAGENWHQFVQYCIANNYAGVENLSLIPGCTGASPMQNIGAYGVEVRDVFYELEAYHIKEKLILRFNKEDCCFGYRESIFKHRYKGKFVILNVTFRLNKIPVFNTNYGAINQELEKMGVTDLSIQAIGQAVVNIRNSKLPNPKKIGNAGSFFKNPTIPTTQFITLKNKFPDIVGYPILNNHEQAAPFNATPINHHNTKLAAGWLIEQCGWKGFRENDAGVHALQALVLVNYGHANGSEIFSLSEKIIQSVSATFGVLLEREVNIF